MFFKKRDDKLLKEKILDLTKNYKTQSSRGIGVRRSLQGQNLSQKPQSNGFIDLTKNSSNNALEPENKPDLGKDLVFGGSNLLNSQQEPKPVENNNTPGFFGLFNKTPNPPQVNPPAIEENSTLNPDAQERKRKLAKRLMDMTDKIEDLSNQIFHLQQRIEVLEQKTRMI